MGLDDENLVKMTDENLSIVNETAVKKKKFTIVKNIDINSPTDVRLTNNESSLPATPIYSRQTTKSNINFEWNFDTESESDFKVNIAKTSLQYNQSSKQSLNNESDECDDVFSLPLKETNNVNYREQEGQDTITSLSNNIYLKQLHKIRKKASVKSKSSLSEEPSIEQSTENLNLLKPSESSSASSKSNIKSFFNKNRGGSLVSRNSIDLQKQESNNSLIQKSILDLTQMSGSENLVSLLKQRSREAKTADDAEMSVTAANATAPAQTTKSDEVFQVLKEVIDNTNDTEMTQKFIEQVIQAVRLQQENEKRKKDLQKKICFGLEMFVFILIFMLGVLLVENVFLKLQNIYWSKLNDASSNDDEYEPAFLLENKRTNNTNTTLIAQFLNGTDINNDV